jgi:hypothetical protein
VQRSNENGKNKNHEGFSSEIKQSKSQDGSPSDSENRTQEIKARNQDKLGKQFVPHWSHQFCYRANF